MVTTANLPAYKVTGLMPSKGITEQDGNYFMLMTEIFCKLYYPKMSCIAEHKYIKRIPEWAARLPKNSFQPCYSRRQQQSIYCI